MIANTKIEWADAVWNPITGCSPISEGCEHCYAKRMASRLKGRYGYPDDDPFRVTFHENRLYKAINRLKPQRIFVCSMSDIAHPDVTMSWFRSIMGIIAINPESVYMVLTKRPAELEQKIINLGRIPFAQRTADDFDLYWREKFPLKNLWIGVTAENQQRADERIPILLQIPAVVRFVSVEPMLGPVDLTHIPIPHGLVEINGGGLDPIKWVIVGQETGPGARSAKAEWFNSIIDQCRSAGVPVFVKKAPAGAPIIREFPEV